MRNIIHKLDKQYYPNLLTYPLLLADSSKFRVGAISFDPIYFLSTSDGALFQNVYEKLTESLNPIINQLQSQIRNNGNKVQDYYIQLSNIKDIRYREKMTFFQSTIRYLFDHYDIIIAENVEAIQKVSYNNKSARESHPVKNILSKPYFSEFMVLMNGMANYNGMHKYIILAPIEIVKVAHNICSKCGTYYENPLLNSDLQWFCNHCGSLNFESVNTAINLRNKYFDFIMEANHVNLTYKRTMEEY